MMDRRTLTIAALGAACLTAGCGAGGPSYTYRFKIRIYATIDGIERVGSTVIRSVWTYVGKWNDSGESWVGKNYGDAVLFPGKGKAAALGLLSNMQGVEGTLSLNQSVFLFYFPRSSGDPKPGNLYEKMQSLSGEREMPAYWGRPALVGFSDLEVIQTAHVLGPGGRSFHAEVNRTTLELTEDEDVDELRKRLPWFDQIGHLKPKGTTLPPQSWPVFRRLESRNIHANGDPL